MGSAPKPQQPIGSLLHHLAHRFEVETSAALCEVDLPLRAFSALIHIYLVPGQSQKTCGNTLGIDNSTCGRMIDRLADQGLIERRSNPQDRRSNGLYLLPKGVERMKEGYVHVQAVEQQVLADLSEVERGVLRNMLERAQVQKV